MDQEYQNTIRSPFMRDVSALLAELRQGAISATSTSNEQKSNEGLSRAQQIFDNSLNAICARLQTHQDRLVERIDSEHCKESDATKSRLRNGLSDLRSLADLKRDSIMAQARARELHPIDPCPLGTVQYHYKPDGTRTVEVTHAPPAAGPVPAGLSSSAASCAPSYAPPIASAPPPAAYPPQQGYPPQPGYIAPQYPYPPQPQSYPPPPQAYPPAAGYPPPQNYGQAPPQYYAAYPPQGSYPPQPVAPPPPISEAESRPSQDTHSHHSLADKTGVHPVDMTTSAANQAGYNVTSGVASSVSSDIASRITGALHF